MIIHSEDNKYVVVLGGIAYGECDDYEAAQDMLEQLIRAINA